ncbi:mannose-6-phosphate isomerase-like protein (cupin superfamily) [Anaerosolibacter carboniphilus]|uniref:Mannose-6-phosphate isomerase-like protein (Cupin superfamily) n=1 Tax=Anaerosolibacter carboniphilus TaxID=1417629 RepID=A0A841KXA6_9FIRM|nr:cupin domain-containing protein [Anaerosolibacter carboniphilus]MBB6217993.1 mannose-6-phosphate isomerase-like protein (cupin superfamily) [Anaerosolibacter carboniphilus]
MYINGNVYRLFETIEGYWAPKIIGEVNDDYIKLAKFKGEFVWHEHENEDEMFYVVRGSFDLHYEDETWLLKEGDIHVVKKGVKHKPVATDECWVMLIERKETKHTGNVKSELTKSIDDQLVK